MRKTLLMLAVIVAVGLAGCSKEDVSQVAPGKKELGVTANVVPSGNATRSVISGTSFSGNNSIGVFVGGTGYTASLATYSTTDGAKWTRDAVTNPIYLNNQIATVYTYYPSSAVLSGGAISATPAQTSININVLTADGTGNGVENSLTGVNQTDYMYGTGRTGSGTSGDPYLYPQATVSNATGAEIVNLYFHHALSKVSFVVNRGTYNGTGTVTKLTMGTTNANFNAAGTMKVADGTLTRSGAISKIIFQGATATINSTTSSTTPIVYGLVVPTNGTITDVVTLTISLDGKDMPVTLPVNDTVHNAVSWLPGNEYRYTITVNGKDLTVNSVSVTDWTVNNVNSGSSVNVQ